MEVGMVLLAASCSAAGQAVALPGDVARHSAAAAGWAGIEAAEWTVGSVGEVADSHTVAVAVAAAVAVAG